MALGFAKAQVCIPQSDTCLTCDPSCITTCDPSCVTTIGCGVGSGIGGGIGGGAGGRAFLKSGDFDAQGGAARLIAKSQAQQQQ